MKTKTFIISLVLLVLVFLSLIANAILEISELEESLREKEISISNLKIINSDLRSELERFQELSFEEGNFPITSEELILLAKVAYLEAGGDTYENQIGVVRTVLNRRSSPNWESNSIEEVVYEDGQFDQITDRIAECKPSESCYKAVIDALKNTINMPNNVDSFQMAGYHYPNSAWKKLGCHYFSSLESYKEERGW